jgi:hypothetical protein
LAEYERVNHAIAAASSDMYLTALQGSSSEFQVRYFWLENQQRNKICGLCFYFIPFLNKHHISDQKCGTNVIVCYWFVINYKRYAFECFIWGGKEEQVLSLPRLVQFASHKVIMRLLTLWRVLCEEMVSQLYMFAS